MRTDEAGRRCPETLGEYRGLCARIDAGSEAVVYLDRQIRKLGRDHVVPVPDETMREMLLPRLAVKAGEWRGYWCPCCGEEAVESRLPRELRPGDLMFCHHCSAVSRHGPDLALAPVDVRTLDTLTQAVIHRERAKRAQRAS